MKYIYILFLFISVYLQTGEYATDEEEEMSPVFPNSIEVFDLAENQDMLSPVELDPEKLAHKFKEVYVILIIWNLNGVFFGGGGGGGVGGSNSVFVFILSFYLCSSKSNMQ